MDCIGEFTAVPERLVWAGRRRLGYAGASTSQEGKIVVLWTVTGWLLNGVYLVLALVASPWVLWRRWRTGKTPGGLAQKFWGAAPSLPPTIYSRLNPSHVLDSALGRPGGPRLWLHAVSVGEVLQLRQVVARLLERRSDIHIVITTTTATGYQVARENFPQCDVAYFPFDFTWSVRRAITNLKPDLICLVELELWPNFIREAARLDIPLALINGRLSERSFRGYRHIRSLVRRLLQQFSIIAVQSTEYRERFVKLGARPLTTVIAGSIKFDGVVTDRANARTRELSAWLGLRPGEKVFVAGSTQPGEESLALAAYEAARRQHSELRLLLAPRHPERADELSRWLATRGHVVRRRRRDGVSQVTDSEPAIGLLDTIGELQAAWGLADIAFVGGSFTSRGGQNMIEPAAYGAAVCYGPNTWNFRQVVELLETSQAAVTVHSGAALQDFLIEMLNDPGRSGELGRRARELVLSQQGATQRTVDLLLTELPPSLQSLRQFVA